MRLHASKLREKSNLLYFLAREARRESNIPDVHTSVALHVPPGRLSVAGSWEIDHVNQVATTSHSNESPVGAKRGEQSLAIERIRNWIMIVQGLSLIACGALYALGIRLRNKARREQREREAADLALEMRVEERTRELRTEVEERRLIEHLHRGQRRIVEMLSARTI